MKMKVIVNDKQAEIAEDLPLCDLLKQLDYQRCVVIINGKHILLKDYSSRILSANDNIKLVRILGGG
jgi:thiamine biosynthesis protein ThiS